MRPLTGPWMKAGSVPDGRKLACHGEACALVEPAAAALLGIGRLIVGPIS
jgi:hypothetical protein